MKCSTGQLPSAPTRRPNIRRFFPLLRFSMSSVFNSRNASRFVVEASSAWVFPSCSSATTMRFSTSSMHVVFVDTSLLRSDSLSSNAVIDFVTSPRRVPEWFELRHLSQVRTYFSRGCFCLLTVCFPSSQKNVTFLGCTRCCHDRYQVRKPGLVIVNQENLYFWASLSRVSSLSCHLGPGHVDTPRVNMN